MKVHHLNCGTLRPRTMAEPMVCHVLLVETDDGLVLVDTGFGLADVPTRGRRFGPARHFIRPACDPDETAARQVEGLGFATADVRHVVLTHFDADHTGGLADFPEAKVHLTADEASAALHPRTLTEKGRYPAVQRAHHPVLVPHETRETESWQGFPAATEVLPGIVLIAMPGHTRGHAAVAVDAGEHWVLHAGDTFYHRAVLDGGQVPRAVALMERAVAHDWRRLRENQRRLAEVWTAADPGVLLVNAHDPELLARARQRDRRR